MTRRGPADATTRAVGALLALSATLLLATAGASVAHAAGTLDGTLRGPDGERFEFFEIKAYAAGTGGGWRVVQTRTISAWDSGLPAGDFRLSLPAGSYRVCFSPAGYEFGETAGATCWEGAHEVHEATDLVIDEADATTIAPQLPREGGLAGRIVGPGDVPVQGYVAPYLRAPDGTWTLQGSGGSATDGTIDLRELNPGRYRFCVMDVPREFIAECWEDAEGVTDATDVSVPPGSSPTIVVRLAARASISGTVTRPGDVDGAASVQLSRLAEPWPGAEPRWQAVAFGAVDPASGTYRITGLDPGTYRACTYGHRTVVACWETGNQPSDADDIVLAAGQARTLIDFSPQQAGYVAGVLPDMYLGAEGFPLVSAWTQTDDGWTTLSTAEAAPTGPGTQWTYELGSLPAGSVVICVEHQDPEFVPAFPRTCLGDSPSPDGGEPVDVTPGEITTAPPLPTGQAGEIRGRVTDPPEPVEVALITRSGRVAATALTNDAGTYRFASLPTGDYRIGFHRSSVHSPLAAEYWRNAQDGFGLAGATAVRVDGSVVSGISATLDQGGTLTGRLVDAEGRPVGGCRVHARGRNGELAERWAVTGAGGVFAIGGLSTAAYLVVLSPACSGTGRSMYFDAQSPTRTSARRSPDADAIAMTRGQSTVLSGDLVTGTPAIAQVEPPALSGSLTVGSTLTSTEGSWNPAVVDRSYRWTADGAPVAGVVGRRLLLTPDLAGKAIRVHEDVTAFGWHDASARSSEVGPVTTSTPDPGTPPPPPAQTTPPSPPPDAPPTTEGGTTPPFTELSLDPVAPFEMSVVATSAARTKTVNGRLRFDSGREVTCASARGVCTVRASLVTKVRRKLKRRTRTVTIVLGTVAFELRPGTSSFVRIRLTKDGSRMLRSRRTLSATLKLSVTAGGQTASFPRAVSLVAPSRLTARERDRSPGPRRRSVTAR